MVENKNSRNLFATPKLHFNQICKTSEQPKYQYTEALCISPVIRLVRLRLPPGSNEIHAIENMSNIRFKLLHFSCDQKHVIL